MPTIRVEPLGIKFEVLDGESIMAAAIRSGYQWPTVCGGEGSCRTCYLTVLQGTENLSSVGPTERESLTLLARVVRDIDKVRLACQVSATGDAIVQKRGVRPMG
jgi:ferredoxin